MKELLLVAGSLVVALLAIEVALWIAGYDPNPSEMRKYHTSLGWTLNPNIQTLDGINTSGFRSPVHKPEKSEGIRRLLVLGDSFTEGMAYPWDQTFPGLTHRWLNELSEGKWTWEILELASRDWGSYQQLVALREVGLSFEPDLVVIQIFPFNDVCNNSPSLADTCSMLDYQRPYITDSWYSAVKQRFLLARLVENRIVWAKRGFQPNDHASAGTFRLKQSEAQGLPKGYYGALATLLPPAAQPKSVRDAWDDTRATLAAFADTLNSEGIPALAVVIPYARSFDPYWEVFIANRYPLIERMNACRLLQEMLKELDIHFIPCNRFSEGPMKGGDHFLMPRDPHLNRYGHASVAKWIVQEIDALNLDDVRIPDVKIGGDFMDVGTWSIATNGLADHGTRRAIRGFGPNVTLAFTAEAGVDLRLAFRIKSEVEGNAFDLFVNQNAAMVDVPLSDQKWAEYAVSIPTRNGRNEVRFEFLKRMDQDKRHSVVRGSHSVLFNSLVLGDAASATL